jgi:hypothetical protein
VCECASVRVCECASVRVCECASVRVHVSECVYAIYAKELSDKISIEMFYYLKIPLPVTFCTPKSPV